MICVLTSLPGVAADQERAKTHKISSHAPIVSPDVLKKNPDPNVDGALQPASLSQLGQRLGLCIEPTEQGIGRLAEHQRRWLSFARRLGVDYVLLSIPLRFDAPDISPRDFADLASMLDEFRREKLAVGLAFELPREPDGSQQWSGAGEKVTRCLESLGPIDRVRFDHGDNAGASVDRLIALIRERSPRTIIGSANATIGNDQAMEWDDRAASSNSNGRWWETRVRVPINADGRPADSTTRILLNLLSRSDNVLWSVTALDDGSPPAHRELLATGEWISRHRSILSSRPVSAPGFAPVGWVFKQGRTLLVIPSMKLAHGDLRLPGLLTYACDAHVSPNGPSLIVKHVGQDVLIKGLPTEMSSDGPLVVSISLLADRALLTTDESSERTSRPDGHAKSDEPRPSPSFPPSSTP